MQGRRARSPTGLINVGTVFDQCLDGNWASKADSMMEGGDAVLVGGMDVRSGLEQCDDLPGLVCGICILLGADAGQFMDAAHQLKS